MSRDRRAAEPWPTREPEVDSGAAEPSWASLTDTGSLAPSPEALAWQQRADAWAQQAEIERAGSAAVEPANRWSEVASNGRPTFPADGVGWRTETAEWRATGGRRWRQTTEWRSTTGSHGWRSTTEAWQTTGDHAAPAAPATDRPAISGTAWPTPDPEPLPPTREVTQTWSDRQSWEQPSSARSWQPDPPTPSWQRGAADPATEPATPSWQRGAADPATEPATPSWQRPSPPAQSWSAPAATPTSGWAADRQPGENTTDVAGWERSGGPGWRRDAGEETSWSSRVGRRRAAEPDVAPAGGTGWSTEADSDSWARHADTGGIELFPDPPLPDPADEPPRRRGGSGARHSAIPLSYGERPLPYAEQQRELGWGGGESPDLGRQDGYGRRALPGAGEAPGRRALPESTDRDSYGRRALPESTDPDGYGRRAAPEPGRDGYGRRALPGSDANGSGADGYGQQSYGAPALPSRRRGDDRQSADARDDYRWSDGRSGQDYGRPAGPGPVGAASSAGLAGRSGARRDGPRYSDRPSNWREETASWETEPDTSSWTRDPDTGQWSRADDDPRVLAWREEAARREAMKAGPPADASIIPWEQPTRARHEEGRSGSAQPSSALPFGPRPGSAMPADPRPSSALPFGPRPGSAMPADPRSGGGQPADPRSGGAPVDQRYGARSADPRPLPADQRYGGWADAARSGGVEPADPRSSSPFTGDQQYGGGWAADPRSGDVAPGDPRPGRALPADQHYGGGWPADPRPGSAFPAGPRSGDFPSGDPRSGGFTPGDPHSGGFTPGDPRPGFTPGDPRSGGFPAADPRSGGQAVDPRFGGSQPVDARPTSAMPFGPRPGSAMPSSDSWQAGAPSGGVPGGPLPYSGVPGNAPRSSPGGRRRAAEPYEPEAPYQSYADRTDTGFITDPRRAGGGPATGSQAPLSPEAWRVAPEPWEDRRSRRLGLSSGEYPAQTQPRGPLPPRQDPPRELPSAEPQRPADRWRQPGGSEHGTSYGSGAQERTGPRQDDRDDPPPNGSAGAWPARRGGYPDARDGGDWRREMARHSELADGESRRYDTSDFPPFRPSGSAAVPGSSNLALTSTSVMSPAPRVDASRPAREEDTTWPPRRPATGSYERRPVAGGPIASRRSDLLDPDDEEDEQRTGGPLAAVGYTVVWYGVPVLLFVAGMFLLNSGQRSHALRTLADAAPEFAISLALSMLVAVGLRWATSAWKAASVGLAAAVVGGGLATVLGSAITGNSLS